MSGSKRRTLLKAAVCGAVGVGASSKPAASHAQDRKSTVPGYGYQLPKVQKGATLLFQGDSITDMKWGRNQKDRNHYLGHSYVFLIASRLHTDMPEAGLNFLNRGMSGHTVPDLQNRWQKDAIDLNPDVLSILIGINDVGRAVRGKKNVDPVAYEEGYRDLLTRSRAANAKLKLVLVEPFVLPVKRDWRGQVDRIRPVVSKLASEFNSVFIPMQTIFDEASKRTSPEHWIWDGVHPLPQGHELIARTWIQKVAEAWA
ncbi:MAG: SGNH/GDSL hydrolase family protein [Planctomycetaceae bacterium]